MLKSELGPRRNLAGLFGLQAFEPGPFCSAFASVWSAAAILARGAIA
jgi:hypothetical protein